MQCQSLTVKGKKCKHIAINKNKCHIHCEENCSINRASLDIYEAPAKQIISLTCDYLPLGEITTILGPATYNEWKTNTGTVGIFGEYHGIPFDEVFGKINKHTTLIFPNFIKVLLDTNTKIQYDLFGEVEYSTSDEQFTPSENETIFYILDIDFKSCFDKVKNCKYKNLRAHSIDYGRGRSRWFNELYTNIFTEDKEIGDFHQLFDILQEYEKNYIEVSTIITKDLKILKQLKSNPLYTSIKSFIMGTMIIGKLKFLLFLKGKTKETLSLLNLKISTYEEFKKECTKTKCTNEKDILEYKLELVFQFIKLYSYIMDIYALGRLFREFNKVGSTHSIVYVGQEHAILYNNFMKYMKYKHIVEIGEDDTVAYTTHFTKLQRKNTFLFK